MTVECMRDQLTEVYPYPKWQQKVARMHEPQVVAVYKSLMKRDQLYPHKKNPEKKPICHQITIWEWIKKNERNDSDSQR